MKVAVAIVFDEKKRVLITRRPTHVPHGGLWEFPGGKLENGELPTAALIREIREEVGLEILECTFLDDIVHQYPSKEYGLKTVTLLIFSVDQYKGEARCCESQTDLRWVHVNQLSSYDFPEANIQIIELIKNRA